MTHMSTHQTILPERWSIERQRTLGQTRSEKDINEYLDTFMVAIQKRYIDTMLRDADLSSHMIKSSLLNAPEDGAIKNILELCDLFIQQYETLVSTQGYGKEAFFRYKVLRNRLSEFIQDRYKVRDLPLSVVDRKFLDNLYLWFRTKHELNNNTTVKTLHRFSSIWKMARDNGWVSCDPFKLQKLHLDKVDRGYLTEEQLETLYKKEFASDRLEKVRDFFIFSCYTGLPYIDLYKLNYDQIKVWGDGSTWISIVRQKTKVPSNIRLLEVPLRLIEKYRGQAKDNKVFPVPSNQKMNDYLKEIGTVCGFPKELIFHMARHTFATTVTLGNGVPIESVSKMMGHTNIKTTQIYARITDQKVNNDMAILASKLDGRYDDLLPKESSKTKHAPDKRKEIRAWAQERNMTV